MTHTAAQLLTATNALASHGIAALARQHAQAMADFADLSVLITTLSAAIAGDTPGAPVTEALSAVEAQVIVAQASIIAMEDLAPA